MTGRGPGPSPRLHVRRDGRWRTDRARRLVTAMAVATVTVLSVVGIEVSTTAPAAAKGGGVGATLGKGTVNAYVEQARTKRTSTSRKRPAKPVVRQQYVLVPDCGTNSPAQTTDGCAEQAVGCPTGTARFRVFEAPLGTATGTATGWSQTATRCLDPATARPGQVVIPQLGLSELRRLPVPPGTAVVEPPGGLAAVNLPINAYAKSADPTVLRTTMLGLDLVIELEPVAFTWDFGDGTTFGPTAEPGGPYPAMTNAHTYRRKGTYAITMTTTYEGRFSVNGGAYQDIPGQTSVASAPVSMRVLSGGASLRAEVD